MFAFDWLASKSLRNPAAALARPMLAATSPEPYL